ncbi:MAG: hypothetical protein J3K34DRAFT_400615 [Monoraphidium minutum]|nr:MAG: hypothetical protein J3K34DRAFT_400615 [Monoraphidium minutum]
MLEPPPPAANGAAANGAGGAAAAAAAGDAEGEEGEDDGGDEEEGPAGSGRPGGKSSRLEHKSLLKLRLALLDARGEEDAYLQLAMRGRMWSEAVGRLLASKDRSKLHQAVRLLPAHIKALPKRAAYVTRLVEGEGLPAAERLELAARLLLDMRGELNRALREVRVAPGSGVDDAQRWSVTAWAARLPSLPGEGQADLNVRTATHNRCGPVMFGQAGGAQGCFLIALQLGAGCVWAGWHGGVKARGGVVCPVHRRADGQE